MEQNPNDRVNTPHTVAREIIEHYPILGRVLDPCRGDGAFYDCLPERDREWCEIELGRDFYLWKEPVDWIITNPPYSHFSTWMEHSMSLANQIVYLIPPSKVFANNRLLQSILDWGGIKEIWVHGPGRKVGFPFGFPMTSMWFRRGYRGATKWRR